MKYSQDEHMNHVLKDAHYWKRYANQAYANPKEFYDSHLARQLLLRSNKPKKCALCRKKKWLTADHIKPKSQGGKTELENLQWLCTPCHKKKTRNDEKAFDK